MAASVQQKEPTMQRLALSAATALALIIPAVAQEPATAQATFMTTDGAEAGSVTLSQGEGGVTISGMLEGMTPGDHGFHFHETGNCDGATKFESAGKHFNPTEHKHGTENPEGPHAGDLPNVTADDTGMVMVELTTGLISLTEGDPAYVFDADGTALVIHAAPDDNVTDPSGNSGDRIACAVIEADNQP
jgi:Cu-Zn family superoxide dismutase